MPFRWNPREHAALLRYLIKWLLLASPVATVIGSAVALFLTALDRATALRWDHPWLLYFLPFGGLAIVVAYKLAGKNADAGNNLIIDQIHAPGGGVPARMTPLVLVATLVTHVFGGSAGREGTAVQMGGSIASTVQRLVGRWLPLGAQDVGTLLTTGIAAGFGAVFGTPLTGAVFALEVLAIGRVKYDALIPCLIAAVVADQTTAAWGIRHTVYTVSAVGGLSHPGISSLHFLLLGKIALAAVAFGFASVIFAELTHGLSKVFRATLPWLARPVVGGLIVIALAKIVGSDYLGLGVHADPRAAHGVSILSCFLDGGATHWSWAWKILFTAITLGSGFKGGEVTPLFFVGAALGNTLAGLMHAPVDLFAALGFVAVFAGATNTPLACTIMGIELFGGGGGLLSSGFVIYLATACSIAYLVSGHNGIYLSQRIGSVVSRASEQSLRELRDLPRKH